MTDGLNELGKSLGKTNDDAGKAVRRKYPQYGMQESARDIFDTEVPYTMHYRVQPTNKKTTLHLAFELPPPDAGLGTCCADCYCAVCEVYEPDDEAWSTTILLARPYVAGSVRLIMSDFQYPDGITETDPEAGIVTINNVAFTSGRTLTICYVYKYDINCTTNAPDIIYCTKEDDFNRTSSGSLDGDWTVQFISGTHGTNGTRAYATNGAVVGYYNAVIVPYTEDFVMEATFNLGTTPASSGNIVHFEAENSDTGEYVWIRVSKFNTGTEVNESFFVGVDTDGDTTSITDSTDDYHLKFDTTQGYKVWPGSEDEPEGWSGFPVVAFTRDRMYFTMTAQASRTVDVDNILFTYICEE